MIGALNGSRAGLGDVQPLRDLTTIRGLIASRSIFFLFDLPFGPFFIAVLYLIHPLLFMLTLGGALIMIAIAGLNQWATSRLDREAAEGLIGATNAAQSFARNMETVRALGMMGNVVELWGARFVDSIEAADRVARTNALFGGLTKSVRIMLQMGNLGTAAYLVLNHEITAGMIFASSLVAGRALQPLDQIVGSWRQLRDAGRAWQRIRALEAYHDDKQAPDIAMPAPKGFFQAEKLIYFVPGADPGMPPLIKGLSFAANPGEAVAIIGPSQAGKSTLARLAVGAISPRSGVVRLDGSDISNWDSDELGKHLGYLAQDVELFPGTIGANIARFDPDARDEDIIKAAQYAHVHDLILGQKNGYSTMIGPTGVRLSGGERQRIGLARALYGEPKLVVLDEPNANLDSEGEAALEQAILETKERGAMVMIITHRPSIAAKCDRVLLLKAGQIELYGPAADVLQRLQPNPARSMRGKETQPADSQHGGGNRSVQFSTALRTQV